MKQEAEVVQSSVSLVWHCRWSESSAICLAPGWVPGRWNLRSVKTRINKML